MAVSAYVLIESAAGRIEGIIKEMRAIEEVESCDAVTGQFDIIARISAPDIHALGRVSFTKIQGIDGVLRTTTCNVVELV